MKPYETDFNAKMLKNERFVSAVNYLIANRYIKNQKELCIKMNISESALSNIRVKKSVVSDKTIYRLNDTFLNIFNLDYLVNGYGELLKNKKTESLAEPTESYNVSKKGCPYYNVDFTLGFDLLENDQTIVPDSYIDFQQYNHCTCWVNAHGDSMHPTISSGDMVALKKIEDYRYLISGEIYAIVTKNGLRTIKRVNDRGKNIQLIPDNKEYEEQYIPKDELLAVFSVKGCMKAY